MIKTQSLMKIGGIIAILATTLAISDSATAIGFGSDSNNSSVTNDFGDTIGQSFNLNTGTATYLLKDWTFAVKENNGGFIPLSGSAILNIYAGVGSSGTVVGSSTIFDSSVIVNGYLVGAKWTFAGEGLSLTSNQTYTAALIGSGQLLNFAAATGNPYINGFVTRNISGNLTDTDTVFSATATAVPFDFEPTGGLLVLGGGCLLRRHLKKRAKKV